MFSSQRFTSCKITIMKGSSSDYLAANNCLARICDLDMSAVLRSFFKKFWCQKGLHCRVDPCFIELKESSKLPGESKHGGGGVLP